MKSDTRSSQPNHYTSGTSNQNLPDFSQDKQKQNLFSRLSGLGSSDKTEIKKGDPFTERCKIKNHKNLPVNDSQKKPVIKLKLKPTYQSEYRKDLKEEENQIQILHNKFLFQKINHNKKRIKLQNEEKINLQNEKKTELQNKKRIEVIMTSEVVCSHIYGYGVQSIVETKDKRIATGDYDGNICISSYNIDTKKWNIDIFKRDAHRSICKYLCPLNGNRLLSNASIISNVKIWVLSQTDLTQIKEIEISLYSSIPLSKDRFASCAWYGRIFIYKDNVTDDMYELLSTLQNKKSDILNLNLQLKDKEVLVSCTYYQEELEVSFWDLNSYTKQYTVTTKQEWCKTKYLYSPAYMRELPNGNLAISLSRFQCEPIPILIIDSSSYQIVTMIHVEMVGLNYSAFFGVTNKNSFFYISKLRFLEISNEDYSTLFQSKDEIKFHIDNMIPIEGGKYFVAVQGDRLSMIKFCDV